MANDKQVPQGAAARQGNPHEWAPNVVSDYLKPTLMQWLNTNHIKAQDNGGFSLGLDQVLDIAALGFQQCSRAYNETQFGTGRQQQTQQGRQSEEVRTGGEIPASTPGTDTKSRM